MIHQRYLDRVPEQVQLEIATCPLCESDSLLKHRFDATDTINGLDGLFGVDSCEICGLYITNPRPTQETIGYYYPDTYGPYNSTLISTNFGAKSLKSRLKGLFRTFEYSTPKLPVGKLLDIGCASGSFINSMKYAGWQVEGLEYSDSAVSNAIEHGLDVHQGGVEDFESSDENYDLITA